MDVGLVFRAFLALCVVIATTVQAKSSSQTKYIIDLDISKSPVSIGEEVKVTCNLTLENYDPSQRFALSWVRKIGQIEIEMAVNHVPNNEFKAAGRYRIERYVPDMIKLNFVSYTLFIMGATTADAGEIGCRIPDMVEVFKPLVVLDEITEFSFESLNKQGKGGPETVSYKGGETLELDEGNIRTWTCRAQGSYPKPVIKVTLGDEDITDRFKEKTLVLLTNPKSWIRDASYDVRLTWADAPVGYEFNGKNLKCSATIPESNFEAKSIGVDVKLTGFKPKFLCDAEYEASDHQKNFTIECPVHADPPLTDVAIHWKLMGGDKNVTLDPWNGKIREGPYSSDVHNGTSGFEKVMILHIDHVFTQHFRTYSFEAENEKGRFIHNVTLIKKPNPEETIGAANFVTSLNFLTLTFMSILGVIITS